MGFFSKTCSCCGYSITSEYVRFSTEEISAAFSRVVWLSPKAIIIGSYDGYGRILNTNIGIDIDEGYEDWNHFLDDGSVLMHEFCWEKIGSPLWSASMPPAGWAADQGYFIDNQKDYENYYLGKENKRTEVNSWNTTNQTLNLYNPLEL
jgi:hypothetical protein